MSEDKGFLNGLAELGDMASPLPKQPPAEATPPSAAEVQLLHKFAEFRREVRGALWSFWPNNPGVGDNEIIDAARRAAKAAAAQARRAKKAEEALRECQGVLDRLREAFERGTLRTQGHTLGAQLSNATAEAEAQARRVLAQRGPDAPKPRVEVSKPRPFEDE